MAVADRATHATSADAFDPQPPGDPGVTGRIIDLGGDLLQVHPRDPGIRARGESSNLDASDRHVVPDDGAASAGLAAIATTVGLIGGFAQNTIDVARLAVKYPEAYRAGRLETAIQLTLLTRPDNRIIDPEAPRTPCPLTGRSFTYVDELGMKASAVLGAGMSVIQLAAGLAILHIALQQDGTATQDISQSVIGRAGLLNIVSGAIGAGVFGAAYLGAAPAKASPGGILAGHSMARMLDAARSPLLARPVVGQALLGAAALIIANQIGWLDPLNHDDSRSIGESLRDAAHATPVLNDSVNRATALAGISALTGYHVASSLASKRTVSPLLAVGAAAVAGAVTLQSLGKLASLDRPDA
jgi:hypothetical protein